MRRRSCTRVQPRPRRYTPLVTHFVTRTVSIEAEIIKGTWRDPDLGRVTFGEFASTWIEHRSNLRPRTVEMYHWLNRRYLEPTFGKTQLKAITPGPVRAWHAELLASAPWQP